MVDDAYKFWRFLVLIVNIIDASIMLDKSREGVSYSYRESLDPYYANLAYNASLSLLCIFAFLLLHQAFYESFFCILEIIWTFCAWVVWLTFGIIAGSFRCGPGICNDLAPLLAGLSFLNWFLLLVLNISIFMHANTQRKGGNPNIWFQMPFATVVMQTTIAPLELQQSPHSSPTNVNPAIVGDGRDETTPHATVDRRLGDGRDNA